MRITIVGTGYVGLVTGVCFSEFGHNVVCVDNDARKIEALNSGEIPIFEPGLNDILDKNVVANRLFFTTDLSSTVPDADAVFIAVGTPSRRGDGRADLSYVFAAAEEIATSLSNYTVVVIKSTVPVGTSRRVEELIRSTNVEADFSVASNPEFLREGAAVEDFMRPDRIIVGTSDPQAEAVIKEIYQPLFLNDIPALFTRRETSELIKYASNAFLATKVSFINEMADLCEKIGADVQDVAKGMGLDGRIGPRFLNAGPGYGGSCLPKDTLALSRAAEDAGVKNRIVSAVVETNDARKQAMATKIIAACGGSVEGKRIAVLGLTFKPGTDDVRESPALDIIPALQEAGADIHAYDPEGTEEAKRLLEDVTYHADTYGPMEGADAVVIITEWIQFRALDFERMRKLTNTTLLVDLRNVYGRDNTIPDFVKYVGIGRG